MELNTKYRLTDAAAIRINCLADGLQIAGMVMISRTFSSCRSQISSISLRISLSFMYLIDFPNTSIAQTGLPFNAFTVVARVNACKYYANELSGDRESTSRGRDKRETTLKEQTDMLWMDQ